MYNEHYLFDLLVFMDTYTCFDSSQDGNCHSAIGTSENLASLENTPSTSTSVKTVKSCDKTTVHDKPTSLNPNSEPVTNGRKPTKNVVTRKYRHLANSGWTISDSSSSGSRCDDSGDSCNSSESSSESDTSLSEEEDDTEDDDDDEDDLSSTSDSSVEHLATVEVSSKRQRINHRKDFSSSLLYKDKSSSKN